MQFVLLRAGIASEWIDDARQACLIALYRCAHRRPRSEWYGIALSAARDEVRRMLDRRRSGLQFASVDADEAPEIACTNWSPFELAAAGEALQAIEARFPGWPAAILQSDDLTAAGASMGVSMSRASQRLREIVTFAESLHSRHAEETPPVARRRPAPHGARASSPSGPGR